VKGSTTDHSAGNQSEEPFHLIKPGAAGGGEMEVESLPLPGHEPSLHLLALVGAVIIHDQMHVLVGGDLLFQMVEESYEFPAAVPVLTSADDFAVENIEGGEQSRSAVAFNRAFAAPASLVAEARSALYDPEPVSGSSRPRTIPAHVLAGSDTGPRCPAPFPRSADRWTV